MAVVLEALLPYVLKMIKDMEEVGMLLGVRGELEKLGWHLRSIAAFLADAERRQTKEELVQGLVSMLKGVMYDATDVLELGQLEVKTMSSCYPPFHFCLHNPVSAHKIGSRIKELNQQLEEIHEEAAKFNFLAANLCLYQEQRTEAEYSSGMRMTSDFISSTVVGKQIERDTRLLVQELITTDENHGTLKVVSIVGMGGMGKTTLAQKIFKDTTIDKHFETKIWLSITQHFSEVELLRSAIKHAGGDHGGEKNNNYLTQTLTNTLSASKFLLVLDDIWSIKAWESVLGVPVTNASDKQPGSRVLITTRLKDLAPRMHHSFYKHHVSPLDEDDAWSLLKNPFQQIMPYQEARVDHLKDVGMKIIRKCGGLPLAVKMLRRLLLIEPKTVLAWEAILNHGAWSLDGLTDELDHQPFLNYEHLPPQLKQCFVLSSYSEQRTQEAEFSSSQRMTPEFNPLAVVGEKIERDTRLLVQELITTDETRGTLKVVSIVGMGGMGKTTLAQKIFKDTSIYQHFKTKIWLSITQQFNKVELLRSAIKFAGGHHRGMENKNYLMQTLTNTLSANKFLLVLDDMRSIKVWESVLGVPVKNASDKQPGSRVLITTRLKDLAPRMHHSFYKHHVSPLDEDDAWSLLKNPFQQTPNQEARVDHLKDVGMKIIRKCGGLPLAVKILGGLLLREPRTLLAWKSILNHHAWSLDGLTDELDHQRFFNYEHLPPQLKQCFLLSSYSEQRTQAAEYSEFIPSAEQRTQAAEYSEFIPSAVVGEKIERETRMLVQELITTNENHGIMKVVSIVGMGGMGKTTLAQKILKDATIEENFKIKIWLSITQQFNEVELLRSAIKLAGGDHGGEENNNFLTHTLTSALSASKFLLVLDDMWSIRAWESVLSVPVTNASDKQPGSRVLITTRFEDVAHRMCNSVYQHHVTPLDEDDAWSLLKNQFPHTLNQEFTVNDQLKGIGMKIIKKCDGLPLAIKIMGRQLHITPKSESGWNSVLNHHAWSLDGLPDELDHRLYLSYECLSPQLKQCFLYCSLFPKGALIVRDIVVCMWVSEGFIPVQNRDRWFSDDELEEIAAEYYDALVVRNLLEPTIYVHHTKDKCTLQNVVHSFAQFLAREELLVFEDDNELKSYWCLESMKNIRRLSIRPTISVAEWSTLQKQESLRTLILFCRISFKPDDSLTCFPSLRVLHIRCEGSDRFVDSLCQLKHLRYLHLEHTDMSRLPDDIDKMKFLLHIKLVNCKKLYHLPRSIIKLVQLRSLSLDGSNVNVLPKGFGELKNLRSLSGFHVQMDWVQSGFGELASLSQLRDLRIEGLEKVHDSSLGQKVMIRNKEHLRYLELNCNSSRPMESNQRATKEVFERLCPPASLENLGMSRYFGKRLPNWIWRPDSDALVCLRYIKLDLPYCTQLSDGLCRLPHLLSMVIVSAPAITRVGPEFQGSSMLVEGDAASTSAGFPRLEALELNLLCRWEEWEWNWEEHSEAAISMPFLKCLVIKECSKLRSLPPGLANISRLALRELKLHNLTNLKSVDNFPSVVELDLFRCRELKSISGLPMLHRITIGWCPNLGVMENVPALGSMKLWDISMETLPEYLRHCVNLRHLRLDCNKKLYDSLVPGSSEWGKISHIKNLIKDYYPKFDEDQ